MPFPPSSRRSAVVVVVVVAAALFAATQFVQRPDVAPGFSRGLAIMPAALVDRGLYATVTPGLLPSVFGFAPGAAPSEVEAAYGIRGPDIETVVETGGPAATLLLGRFDVTAVARRFSDAGYGRAVEEQDGWVVVERGSAARGPLTAAAETVLLRPDAIFLGGASDVRAVVDAPAADTLPWLRRLVATAGEQTGAVALGPRYAPADNAGEGAPPVPAGGRIAPYEGWLLALDAGPGDQRQGHVAIAYAAPAAQAAQAGRLAVAVRRLPTFGELELAAGAPTWDAGDRVARVAITVRGRRAGWEGLRRLLEGGDAAFLRASGPGG